MQTDIGPSSLEALLGLSKVCEMKGHINDALECINQVRAYRTHKHEFYFIEYSSPHRKGRELTFSIL